jgi:hypothetical protein
LSEDGAGNGERAEEGLELRWHVGPASQMFRRHWWCRGCFDVTSGWRLWVSRKQHRGQDIKTIEQTGLGKQAEGKVTGDVLKILYEEEISLVHQK